MKVGILNVFTLHVFHVGVLTVIISAKLGFRTNRNSCSLSSAQYQYWNIVNSLTLIFSEVKHFAPVVAGCGIVLCSAYSKPTQTC